MATAWIGWGRWAALDSDLGNLSYDAPEYAEKLSDRDRWSALAIGTSAAGSAVFAATSPLWLPSERTFPSWAWIPATVGIAALGTGTALWLENGRLEPTTCVAFERCERPRSTVPLAPLLVTQGAAVLSVPLTYVVRGWLGGSASVGVQGSFGGFGIAWRTELTGS
jgi:hypothetical protein